MATAKNLKMLNIEKAKQHLQTGKPFTNISLAKASGLSVATCGNILREMIASGEVKEGKKADSTGGRPSRQVVYNENFSFVLSLYIRKEKDVVSICCSVANLLGKVIYQNKTDYSQIAVHDIEKTVVSAKKVYPNIKALAIGVPGVADDGTIHSCDIDSLAGIDIKNHFTTSDLSVVLINDVNCCTLGYAFKNGLSKKDSLVYIYYPDEGCPGAGIIIGRKILTGFSNFAGEIGSLPFYQSDSDKLPTPGFTETLAKTISAIACLVNPKSVVLSGHQISDKDTEKLAQQIEKYIPKRHIPSISYEADIHESYMSGLTGLALEQLTYNYKLVERE